MANENTETQGARQAIDNMTRHLIQNEPTHARNPERAREIARQAALRADRRRKR